MKKHATPSVAISNSRLLKLEEGQVTFRYKDYADDHQLARRSGTTNLLQLPPAAV